MKKNFYSKVISKNKTTVSNMLNLVNCENDTVTIIKKSDVLFSGAVSKAKQNTEIAQKAVKKIYCVDTTLYMLV